MILIKSLDTSSAAASGDRTHKRKKGLGAWGVSFLAHALVLALLALLVTWQRAEPRPDSAEEPDKGSPAQADVSADQQVDLVQMEVTVNPAETAGFQQQNLK